MARDAKVVADLSAWASNVLTSVFIVFVNKALMKNYGYQFATTLTGLHFLACTLLIMLALRTGYIKRTTMPRGDLILFTAIADVSIVTLNLSLMINTVSFYQIAKLLIIPFVCFVEAAFLGRTFSRQVSASILLVVAGVAIVTVQDLQLDISLGGMVIAAVSVVSSGLQQIFVRSMQQKHKLSAHELLSKTAPTMALSLLLVGPPIDKLASDAWVFSYSFSGAAAVVMAVSCSLAVLVNISQFMCLGRFSAVSFQVLGHSKTVLVLLGGWAFLGDHITPKKAAGMALAVAGMIWYGKATSSAPAAKPAGKGKIGASPTPVELSREQDLIGAINEKLDTNPMRILVGAGVDAPPPGSIKAAHHLSAMV